MRQIQGGGPQGFIAPELLYWQSFIAQPVGAILSACSCCGSLQNGNEEL